MKRHIVTAIIAVFLAGFPVFAQHTGTLAASDIKIFAANIGSVPVDLSLGGDNPVFNAKSIAPGTVTKFSILKNAGSWQLSYKSAGNEGVVKNAEGRPLAYALQAGKSYLIRYAGPSKAELFQIAEPDTNAAKIAFVNASDIAVGQIQVGSAFGQNTLVAMKNLPAGEHSNFGSVNFAANYGLFWSTGASTTASLNDASGKPLQTMFAEGSYWVLVLAKDAKGALGGQLFSLGS